MGRRKAKVLPLPVTASAATSFLSRKSGIVVDCKKKREKSVDFHSTNCVPIKKNGHNLGGKDSFELLNVMNAQNESEELKIDYIFNFDPIVNLGVRSK